MNRIILGYNDDNDVNIKDINKCSEFIYNHKYSKYYMIIDNMIIPRAHE